MQVNLSSRGRLHKIWDNMKQRCTNPNATGYENYGGRGITYCSEWKNWEPFKEWAISHGYDDSLEIERIDNDKGYNPDNCTWVTIDHQLSNRRKRKNTLHRHIGIRSIHGNKWRAVIDVQKVAKHLGVFDTEQAAIDARNKYIVDNNLPHKLN